MKRYTDANRARVLQQIAAESASNRGGTKRVRSRAIKAIGSAPLSRKTEQQARKYAATRSAGGGLDAGNLLGDVVGGVGEGLNLLGRYVRGSLAGTYGAASDLVQGEGDLGDIVTLAATPFAPIGAGYINEEGRDAFEQNEGAGDLYNDSLKDLGLKGTALDNKWVRRGFGLVGDIATDPLTYLLPGAAGGARQAARIAGTKGVERVAAEHAAKEIAESGIDDLVKQAAKHGGEAERLLADEAAIQFKKKTFEAAQERATTEAAEFSAKISGPKGLAGATDAEVQRWTGLKAGLHIQVPGTGRVAKRLHLPSAADGPVTARILPKTWTDPVSGTVSRLGKGVARGRVGTKALDLLPGEDDKMRELTKLWQSGNPETSAAALSAHAGRAEGKAWARRVMHDLTARYADIRTKFTGTGDEVVDAIEQGRAESVQGGAEMKRWLGDAIDRMHEAGVPVNELDDYFPRQIVDDMVVRRKFDPTIGRRGVTIEGEALKGTPSQIRQQADEYARSQGAKEGYFEKNPDQVMPNYLRSIQEKMVTGRTLQKMRAEGHADYARVLGIDPKAAEQADELTKAITNLRATQVGKEQAAEEAAQAVANARANGTTDELTQQIAQELEQVKTAGQRAVTDPAVLQSQLLSPEELALARERAGLPPLEAQPIQNPERFHEALANKSKAADHPAFIDNPNRTRTKYGVSGGGPRILDTTQFPEAPEWALRDFKSGTRWIKERAEADVAARHAAITADLPIIGEKPMANIGETNAEVGRLLDRSGVVGRRDEAADVAAIEAQVKYEAQVKAIQADKTQTATQKRDKLAALSDPGMHAMDSPLDQSLVHAAQASTGEGATLRAQQADQALRLGGDPNLPPTALYSQAVTRELSPTAKGDNPLWAQETVPPSRQFGAPTPLEGQRVPAGRPGDTSPPVVKIRNGDAVGGVKDILHQADEITGGLEPDGNSLFVTDVFTDQNIVKDEIGVVTKRNTTRGAKKVVKAKDVLGGQTARGGATVQKMVGGQAGDDVDRLLGDAAVLRAQAEDYRAQAKIKGEDIGGKQRVLTPADKEELRGFADASVNLQARANEVAQQARDIAEARGFTIAEHTQGKNIYGYTVENAQGRGGAFVGARSSFTTAVDEKTGELMRTPGDLTRFGYGETPAQAKLHELEAAVQEVADVHGVHINDLLTVEKGAVRAGVEIPRGVVDLRPRGGTGFAVAEGGNNPRLLSEQFASAAEAEARLGTIAGEQSRTVGTRYSVNTGRIAQLDAEADTARHLVGSPWAPSAKGEYGLPESSGPFGPTSTADKQRVEEFRAFQDRFSAHRAAKLSQDRAALKADALDVLDRNTRLQEQLAEMTANPKGVEKRAAAAMEESAAHSQRAADLIERALSEQHGQMAHVAILEAQAAELEAAAVASGAMTQKGVLTYNTSLAQKLTPKLTQRVGDDIMDGFRESFPGQFGATQAHPDIIEALTHVSKVNTPEGLQGFFKHYDSLLNFTKAWQISTPGFHVRNFMGGAFNNYLADISPGAYSRFMRTRSQWRKAAVDGVVDLGKVPAKWRQSVENYDQLKGYIERGQYSLHEIETGGRTT
mgnify:FL=1